MLAYYLGFGLETAIWIISLIALAWKEGYAGIMKNFAISAVMPFIIGLINIFAGGFPVYAGGPLTISGPLGAFGYGVFHAFEVVAILNLIIALVVAAVAKAAKLRIE